MSASVTPVRRGRALFTACVALIAGIASYVLGVRSELGQRVEQSVLDASQFTTSPPAPLNLVSVPSVFVAVILIGAFALALHGVRRAIVVTVVPAILILASQLLKQQFLERPVFIGLDTPNTFPSGHMTVFAALVAASVWAVPATWRSIVGLLGALLLSVVGWQLLAYGWHRPSDVLGALALVTFGFALIAFLTPSRVTGRAAFGFTVQGILLIITAAGFVTTIAALCIALLGEHAGSTLMLIAGTAGIMCASTLCTITFITLSARRPR